MTLIIASIVLVAAIGYFTKEMSQKQKLALKPIRIEKDESKRRR